MRANCLMMMVVLSLNVLMCNAASVVPVLLTNELCKVELHPETGCCLGYEVHANGFDFRLAPGTELLRDVFSRKAMEGEHKAMQFQSQLKSAEQGRQLELTAKLDAANADESAAGLEFKKVVKLGKGQRCLEIVATLFNPTKDVMGASLGVRNRSLLSELKGVDVYYLPTERNVLRLKGSGIDVFYARTGDWDYQPVEGWLALVNEQNKAGLVFVMDAQYLDSFYVQTASGTGGWFQDAGLLMPGSAIEVQYAVIPVKNFSGIKYASRRLIADVKTADVNAGMEITHLLAGATGALGNVTLKTQVYGVRTKTILNAPPVVLTNVGLDPVAGKTRIDQPQSEPIVIRVEAEGAGWKEAYEAYHEGTFKASLLFGCPYKPEYQRPKMKR